jgi:hypothetical protein
VLTDAITRKRKVTSETSVDLHQTPRRNNPEDSHLHTRRRENLKSRLVPYFSYFSQLQFLYLSVHLALLHICSLLTIIYTSLFLSGVSKVPSFVSAMFAVFRFSFLSDL